MSWKIWLFFISIIKPIWKYPDGLTRKKEQRDLYTDEVKRIISLEMEKFGLKCEVEGRAKHFYSIYSKMKDQGIDFDEVYDLIAFRIILDTDKEKECYEALSIVHALWKPVPGRFKDRIAMPKANGYQSLHTTVIGPYGRARRNTNQDAIHA